MATNTNSLPLVAILRDRNPALANQAQRVIDEAHQQLAFAPSTFPSGTDHTHVHTTTVERIARRLMPDALISALSDDELFFLAVVCHYHDLGMVGTVADDATAEGRDQVRRDHSIRIGQRLREDWMLLGFQNGRDAEILAEVCRGHRPNKNAAGEANWDDLDPVAVRGPDAAIRLRLVAALIYAADELHIGADRAPERVEHWRQITDEESRRHWIRHRAIHGPALDQGRLIFQVKVETPGVEDDIRSQVLQKAFRAVRDLARQMERDGITVPLPTLEVHWDRSQIWDLLLPAAVSDLVPRSRGEIIQAIQQRFQPALGRRSELADLCFERGDDDTEIGARISRTIDDAFRYRHLVEAPDNRGRYRLSDSELATKAFFDRAREADRLDEVLLGRCRPRWEQRLFASALGREHVARHLYPEVEATFSVQLTTRPATDPLRTLLERSPTSARLAIEYQPARSALVREFLLRQVAITGAFCDAFDDPEVLLDEHLRKALRELTQQDQAATGAVRLLEEVALVGGFSMEQITEMIVPSEAMQQALEDRPGMEGGIRLSIHQSLTRDLRPTTSAIHILHLAGLRAGQSIQIAAGEGAQLDVAIEGHPEPTGRQPRGAVLEIGPGAPSPPPRVGLPGRLEVDHSTRTIRLCLFRFDELAADSCPVVVRLAVPPGPQQAPIAARISVAVRVPRLVIRDVENILAANQLLTQEGVRFELLFGDSGRFFGGGSLGAGGATLFNVPDWYAAARAALQGLDGELPFPQFVSRDDLMRVASASPADREAYWREVRDRAAEERPVVTYFLLQMVDAVGRVYGEEFLGFVRGTLSNPFVLDAQAGVSQQDLDRQWQAGAVSFSITGSFTEDTFQLSNVLLEWADDLRADFPLHFTSQGVTEPGLRSVVTMAYLPSVDRTWHRFRPVVIQVRPANPVERYAAEAEYWRSVNDEGRAQLADEIRLRFAAETTTEAQPAPEPPVPERRPE
jgi:hypothetical protein